MRYRARKAFLAVRYGPFKFVTIKVGSVITLQSDVHPSGLVSVLYDGQIVSVFKEDIEAKTDVTMN
jgi:hypothetical protein